MHDYLFNRTMASNEREWLEPPSDEDESISCRRPGRNGCGVCEACCDWADSLNDIEPYDPSDW